MANKKFNPVPVTVITMLALAAGYAAVRYNVGKNIPWEHFPGYVLNKAIAVTAVLSIGLSYIISTLIRMKKIPGRYAFLKRKFGLTGFFLAAFHGFTALRLLTPEMYPYLHNADGSMNPEGEWTIIFGVTAIIIFSLPAIASTREVTKWLGYKRWLLVQRTGYFALLVVMCHNIAVGSGNWLNISGWPFWMPPITLLVSVFILFVLLFRLAYLILKKQQS